MESALGAVWCPALLKLAVDRLQVACAECAFRAPQRAAVFMCYTCDEALLRTSQLQHRQCVKHMPGCASADEARHSGLCRLQVAVVGQEAACTFSSWGLGFGVLGASLQASSELQVLFSLLWQSTAVRNLLLGVQGGGCR